MIPSTEQVRRLHQRAAAERRSDQELSMVNRERLTDEMWGDETNKANDTDLPHGSRGRERDHTEQCQPQHESDRPSDCAVSSPRVSASSPRETSVTGTTQKQKTAPSKSADDQLMKPVVPGRNICIARQMSGFVSSSSEVTRTQQKAITMPASSRLAVCRTPRERVIVSSVAPAAPTQAAPVTPSLLAHASPLSEASAFGEQTDPARLTARRRTRYQEGRARPVGCETRPARSRPQAQAKRRQIGSHRSQQPDLPKYHGGLGIG